MRIAAQVHGKRLVNRVSRCFALPAALSAMEIIFNITEKNGKIPLLFIKAKPRRTTSPGTLICFGGRLPGLALRLPGVPPGLPSLFLFGEKGTGG